MNYCHALIEAGFDVMSFDFRSQGESDTLPGYTPNHWPTMYEVEDVRAAIEYISQREDLRQLPLGLMGVSRGSTMALIAAAECPSVQAVCCEGAYSTDSLMLYFMMHWGAIYMPSWLCDLIPRWHFQITTVMVRWTSSILRQRRYVVLERWLPRLRNRPVLLVAGERDNYVHPDVARQLIRCIQSSAAQVWQVPKAKHNRARSVAAAEYDRRLTDFFSQLHAPVAAS
jgi:pimeloyl-ACP methyl ester carboxylesterase